jgi:methylmalonyl-CoA epimerase
METFLDHVAIAVKDLEKSVSFFETLGLKFSDKREVVESQKVKTAFANIDKNSHLELLESTDPEGAISKFIAKKGEGIHHLCFRVSDVKAMQGKLLTQGLQFIYEKPFIGAGNCLVNFIHPKSANGCLIEISQKL